MAKVRDRPVQVEITPAMLEAGMAALYAADDELLGWSSEGTVSHLAIAAYEAMERARLIEAQGDTHLRSP
jgi:hypothetical protein